MSVSLSEYAAITAAANTLGDANIQCDFNLCRSLFHQDALIAGFTGDNFVPGIVAELERAIQAQGPLPKFRSRVDILALDGNIALVRVPEEEVLGQNFVNYLTMFKLNGEWKCISMAYAPNT